MIKMFLAIFLISVIAGLSINYFKDKKRKIILLNKILNNEIEYEKIFITDSDGDGYQYLKVMLNKKPITLALHFDIEKTCQLLSEKSILFSGKYIR